jgi:hypothetical protein
LPTQIIGDDVLEMVKTDPIRTVVINVTQSEDFDLDPDLTPLGKFSHIFLYGSRSTNAKEVSDILDKMKKVSPDIGLVTAKTPVIDRSEIAKLLVLLHDLNLKANIEKDIPGQWVEPRTKNPKQSF